MVLGEVNGRTAISVVTEGMSTVVLRNLGQNKSSPGPGKWALPGLILVGAKISFAETNACPLLCVFTNMTSQALIEVTTMNRIYSEAYRSANRDFKIAAFQEKGKITVKIYEIIDGRTTVIPQFEASLRVQLTSGVDVSTLPMFQKLIKASKLFLESFQ